MARTKGKRMAPPRRRAAMLQVPRGPKAKRFELLHVDKEGDIGFNLVTVEETVIPPGAHLPPTDVPVDMRIKLPVGTAAVIWPRSSTHLKYPTLVLCQAPIDNGYTGPIDPRFRNVGLEPVTIPAGAALAQLVLCPVLVPEVIEVDGLPETARGDTRYGSTGR